MTIKCFLIMNMRSTRYTHHMRAHTQIKPHVYDQSNRICAFTHSHAHYLALSRTLSLSHFSMLFFPVYVQKKSSKSGMTRKG